MIKWRGGEKLSAIFKEMALTVLAERMSPLKENEAALLEKWYARFGR